DIRVAMSGNLCRCTGYVGIVRAIQSVIAERKAKGLSSPVSATTALGPAGSGHAKPAAASGAPAAPTVSAATTGEPAGNVQRPAAAQRTPRPPPHGKTATTPPP